MITVILPDWYQGLSLEARKKPWVRLKLRIMVALTSKLLGFGFDDMRIAYAGPDGEALQGKTVLELAKESKLSPFDQYLKICEDSHFEARVLMGAYQNDEICSRLMRHPLSLYMTDAWLEEAGIQNGALYGAFPAFMRKAMDEGFPLEAAVAKATDLTAKRFKLKDRGRIQAGYKADLLLFDQERFASRMEQALPPKGLVRVYVNGQRVVEGGVLLKADAGRAIRV